MVVHETAQQLSAGLLLHRAGPTGPEVLIGHMGGPFWAKKDEHGWSIPKGLREPGDHDLLAVAEREFTEEMGSPPPAGETLDLGAAKAGRKTNHIFARAGDFDASSISSNTFEMEWPRGTGRMVTVAEIDRAEWFDLDTAAVKLVKGQLVFLDRLREALA